MTQVVQGSLTLVNVNTPVPEVFWNGKLVPGVIAVRVDCDSDEQRVKLKVSGTDEALYEELSLAGIVVKKVLI